MRKAKLIVWAEQGIGDELMFSTVLNDAVKDFDIYFECHPRLVNLHKSATYYSALKGLYPTRKDDAICWPVTDEIRADYKCGIADLCALYRRDLSAFKKAWDRSGPTYTAPVEELKGFRAQLQAMAAGRPIVALATRGGVMQTSRQYRTLKTEDAKRLFEGTNCLFVGIDYDDMHSFSSWAEENYPGRYLWLPSIAQHFDYEHLAALLAACDLVVTVCQSAAHLAAYTGCRTRVLTPKRCAWRYAPTQGDLWYWAPTDDVRLYRQDDSLSWERPIQQVIDDIRSLA